jgi:hypothetical protein
MISSDPGAIVSAGTGAGIASSQNVSSSEFDDEAPATIAPARPDSIGSTPPAQPELAMLLLPGPMATAAMTGTAASSGYSRAAAPAEATLDRSLGDAGVSSNSALRSPENIRALVALSQQSLAMLLAAPQGSGRAAILQLAGLLRAMLGTDGSSGEAIGQLRAFLSQHSTDAVLALLASPAPASSAIPPAVGLPITVAAQAARSDEKEAVRDDDRPAGDRRGRRATPAEQRLAELALDPRQGLAPEGVAAYEAERQEGMCLQRCPSGEHDYVDETGVPWDVVAPSGSLGLEATLRVLLPDANVILSLTKLPPAEWPGAIALVRRLASLPGARRLIALGADV